MDLSAAHGLKSISVSAFFSCKALKQVLLNEGLETIGKYSFADCGLERLFVPGSVRFIGSSAFFINPLTQVRFLGITAHESHNGRVSDNANDCRSEREHRLVIGEEAFSDCKDLTQVIFDPGSAVEEIQQTAFQ